MTPEKRDGLSFAGAELMVSTEADHPKRRYWWFSQGHEKSLIPALFYHSRVFYHCKHTSFVESGNQSEKSYQSWWERSSAMKIMSQRECFRSCCEVFIGVCFLKRDEKTWREKNEKKIESTANLKARFPSEAQHRTNEHIALEVVGSIRFGSTCYAACSGIE